MVSKKVVVTNTSGFHVRPAGVLAKTAESCDSKVEIRFGHNIVNAKSLLNILSASIRMGDEIVLSCEGPNEVEDLKKMLDTMNELE